MLAATAAACLAFGAPPALADPPRLTSITAAKDEITVPEQTTVEAKADRSVYNSGYIIAMVEEGRGEQICNASDTCWRTVVATWNSDQLDPQPARVHAEIRDSNGQVVERSESVEIQRSARFFDVDLTFSSYVCCKGFIVRKATAQSDPNVIYTRLEIRLRGADGTLRCASGNSYGCSKQIAIGDTVRGTVEDPSGEQVFGASPFYTMTEDALEREEADDVALVPLAARFPTVHALCDWLLTMPSRIKTYFSHSTVSDQDWECQAAIQAGVNVRTALKMVAAAGGGTAVLWYLAEDTAREQMPVETVEGDPEPSEDPYPVPPIINWNTDTDGDGQTDMNEDAEELVRRNQDEFERRNVAVSERLEAARKILKECRIRLGEYLKDVLTPIAQPGDCVNTPIFVSGDIDVPKATEHDYASVLRFPIWFAQRYRDPDNNLSPRFWYQSLPQCQGQDVGNACHEFPYFATEQGGTYGTPRPRVKSINGRQNSKQGALFKWFGKRCLNNPPAMEPIDGRPLFVLPAPQGSGLSTLQLCNRSPIS